MLTQSQWQQNMDQEALLRSSKSISKGCGEGRKLEEEQLEAELLQLLRDARSANADAATIKADKKQLKTDVVKAKKDRHAAKKMKKEQAAEKTPAATPAK